MLQKRAATGCGPGGSGWEKLTGWKHPLSTASRSSTQAAIRAELAGSDSASALGLVAISSSPVLALCRLLVEAGHDPGTPMTCCRGDVGSLRIRSIGEAAQLEINGPGTGFCHRARLSIAPPMRWDGLSRENDSPPSFPSRAVALDIIAGRDR